MRYLVAPNAFKGTIPADEAAKLIADTLGKKPDAECWIQPIADGGDGTCALLIDSLGLEKIHVLTLNAVGRPIYGYFGWDATQNKAYLDLATASGIGVLEKHQKNPAVTSTYGTGILILKALEKGAEEIVLGLGGSATVDLGTGILNALGLLFLNESGREIPMFSPGFLEKVQHVQRAISTPKIKFTCLCDVRSPFLGANGAVRIFGPQKGIDFDQLDSFGKSSERILELLIKKSKKEWTDQPGFGAAGGVAMGLQFFFDTEIKFGSSYFFDLVKMEEKVRQSDWIITGEGQYDTQSDEGKASFELLNLAKANQKKIVLITSGTGGRDSGFDLVLELPELDFSAPDFKEKARENLIGLIDLAILEGKLD
ncbi:glycerate kinase [Algoriphagus terrigena]|uniref:glycerate kinase n=1 Tax=Algoriphagus terrigena TaxID=344884 RepID=UPI00040DD5D1|nr:glycerate kinase [Algoriphagus terrigena]